MWATGEEAAGDHRVELNRLHVLNPFAEGQRRAEGAGTKCTRCPKWNTRWQEVGRRPLKTTPGPLPRWDGLCDRSGQRWQGGRPGAPPPLHPHPSPRACRSIMGKEGSDVGSGPGPLLPVNWLHPNKQANTDNSLVHNKLNSITHKFRKDFSSAPSIHTAK